MDLLYQGKALTDIQNRLGNQDIQSITIYFHFDLNRRRHIQKQSIRHMDSLLNLDPTIEELLQWESDKTLWLGWIVSRPPGDN
jgi:hypothetical protein